MKKSWELFIYKKKNHTACAAAKIHCLIGYTATDEFHNTSTTVSYKKGTVLSKLTLLHSWIDEKLLPDWLTTDENISIM